MGRYFTLWSAAKELHHREHSAQQVLGFSIKNKVFTALNKHKDKMKRAFTIRALDRCDLQTLSMDDMDLMKVEFSDVYFELI